MGWDTVCIVIGIIIVTIIVQYLLNPSWHKIGLPREREIKKEKSEEDKKKEEEFYKEIWTAKKRKS